MMVLHQLKSISEKKVEFTYKDGTSKTFRILVNEKIKLLFSQYYLTINFVCK